MSNASCEPMDRLMATLRVRLPGSTDAMIGLEIVNIVDEFFRRTNAWRWNMEFDLEEGLTTYGIDPPANSVLVRVMWMRTMGHEVYAASEGAGGSGRGGRGRLEAAQTFEDGDAIFDPSRVVNQGQGAGAVLRYAIFFPKYVEVSLAPDKTAAKYPMTGQIALSIDPQFCCDDCSAIDVEEWMYNHFFEAWLHGVQYSMMSQIGKPYTNPVMAEFHGRKFRQKCAFHKQEADRGLVHDVQRWRYPRGGFITS